MKIGLRHVDDKDATFIAEADMLELSRIRLFINSVGGVWISSRGDTFPVIAERVCLGDGQPYIELILGKERATKDAEIETKESLDDL